MRARNIPRDGQAEARTTTVSAAGALESVEGTKCLFSKIVWNARAAVIDMDHYLSFAEIDAQFGLLTLFNRVFNKVGQTPTDRNPFASVGEPPAT
jgi:hypothetical protein